MYTNLLLATDGSRLSENAVNHAIGLASKIGAKVSCLYVAPDYPEPMYLDGGTFSNPSRSSYEAAAAAAARTILDKVAQKAAAAGVAVDSHHTISPSPSESILNAATKFRCDAIVMGSHGRSGVAALLLGSQTQKVLAHSKLPVIVAR
jgi:nucleotide-binding universal stress UspA family protein